MRTDGLIPRVLVYAVLIVAIAAGWVVVSVLAAPPPRLPAEGVELLQSAVVEDTTALMTDRMEALATLAETGEPETWAGWDRAPRGDRAGEFEWARDRAASVLAREIEGVEGPGGGLPSLTELDEELDEADALYWEQVAEAVALEERIRREAMAARAPNYIRYRAFLQLYDTVRRDVISYRTLESLQLHELKKALYQNESDTNREMLGASEEASEERLEGSLSELDGRYAALVAELIERWRLRWASGQAGALEVRGRSEVLGAIRARVGGFALAEFHPARRLEPSTVPSLGTQDWVRVEGERTEQFGGIIGEAGDE